MYCRCVNFQIAHCLRSASAEVRNTRIKLLNLRKTTQRERIALLSAVPSEPEKQKESKEGQEDSKSWRENPNLKYWIIGTLGISGAIYQYVYRNHEKKRLRVKSLPVSPIHYVHTREKDVTALSTLHTQLKKTGPFTVLHIVGCPGSGKTELARAFAENIAKNEEERHTFLPGNLLYGTLNGSSVDSLLFDVKRFAISVGCLESNWTSKAGEGVHFNSLPKEEQLYFFVEAVKEKLNKSQGWVLILENVKDSEVLTRWFSNNSGNSWGNGTILVTRESNPNRDLLMNSVYSIDAGMEIEDGVQLLSKISGLDGDKMTAARDIVTLLNSIPLALTCAGHYMQSKAAKSPDYSSTDFLNEVKLELQNFTKANGKTSLAPTHVVVAMETKSLVEKNIHLLHTFDFLGTCTSDWPIPITLIALHLRSPDFSLPPVVGSGPALPSQKPAEVKKEDNAGEEVEEMFLSIKKLAKNLESFMTAVKDNVDAIKAMLNPELPDMPQMVDGVVEMLKTCPLISVVRMEPMGVETVVVSPLVHSVFQQLFLSRTMHQLEAEYLARAEEKHNTSSWFRRLWRFDAQRTLQEHRNSLGEVSQEEAVTFNDSAPDSRILPACTGPVVSDLLQESVLENREEFRKITTRDAVRHCQEHTARILKTINGVASVCGQDNQTRTLARLLKPHLDHILASGTSKSLGPKSRAHAISAVASIDASLGNLESSRGLLEDVLAIETQLYGESSLEVASTLTRLSDVYSSLDDLQKCRELLERAIQIYESQRRKSGEYKQPLDYSRNLSALGATYGSLGFKERSRDYIERSFSILQSAAPTNPDEVEARRFTSDVASTLTDLGHAYLSLGETTPARRFLDMALNGHKNIHGDEHPEVVRTLTVLGIAYTMQGNWPEARKMRKEAGKLQAKLDAKPLI